MNIIANPCHQPQFILRCSFCYKVRSLKSSICDRVCIKTAVLKMFIGHTGIQDSRKIHVTNLNLHFKFSIHFLILLSTFLKQTVKPWYYMQSNTFLFQNSPQKSIILRSILIKKTLLHRLLHVQKYFFLLYKKKLNGRLWLTLIFCWLVIFILLPIFWHITSIYILC